MTVPRNSKYSIAFGGIIALAVAIGFGRFVFTPILPFMISDGVVDEPGAGTIATFNYIGYLVGAFAVARFGKFGEIRFWFLLALAINACMTLAMGLFQDFAMLGLIRFISGVSSAYAFVLAATLVVNRLTAIGATGMYGVQFIGVGTGIAASSLLVAGLANLGLDWQVHWIMSGLVSAAGMIVTVFLFSPERESVAKVSTNEPSVQFSWPLIRLVLAYGLFGVGYVITATFISTIVHQESSLQVLEPYIWLLVGLSAVPSAAIMSRFAVKFGNSAVFSIGCLVEALGVSLSVLSTNPILVALSAILFGGTFVGITAVGLIEAGRLAPGSLRRAIGYMTASFGLGQIIGPITAGEMHHYMGSFTHATIMASLLLIVASILTIRPSREKNTKNAS